VKKHYNIDARKEFVKDYIFPAIKANALYQKKYCLATALARPLSCRKSIRNCKKRKSDIISTWVFR
jgi:argininosuccinate synthase (EC 6.3.4.5)